MKSTTWIIAALMATTPAIVLAEGDAPAGKGKCASGKCGKGHRAEMLKKFDTDGDGKLSETEREAAKAARKEARAAFIAKHDTDGDGKLSKDERQAAAKEFLTKYDTDGDGKLSKEERKVAHDAGERPPFRHHGRKHKMHCKKHHQGDKKPDAAGE